MQTQVEKFLVVGLGASGLALARWLVRAGAAVRVADTRADPPQLATLQAALPQVEFVHGAPHSSWLEGVQQVALSPGVALTQAPWAAWMQEVQARGLAVVGEIEVFARALQDLQQQQGYTPKILAITGTNGKTTTTSLTTQLLERAGKRVMQAGNISPPALDALQQALDTDSLPEVWVLELSSFQLATTTSLRADAAAWLNLTQDHLDWHSDMAAYAAAKARIFAPTTVRVLNRNDASVFAYADTQAPWVSFGADLPTRVGDLGVLQENGMLWMVEAVADEQALSEQPKTRKKNLPEPAVPVQLKRLMPAEALRIRGLHNVCNALAALQLCRALGLSLAPLLHGLREYRGEPHRVEFIGSVAGVEFIDDSKGTNVGATVAALQGLQRPVYLIAGGDGKGQDFSPLLVPIQQSAQAVYLIGKDAAAIAAVLTPHGVRVQQCDTLESATALAFNQAQQDGLSAPIVLLSPACASLDMFRDYAQRAQVFVKTVQELASARGVALEVAC